MTRRARLPAGGAVLLGVAGLTLLALALRLTAIDQTLFGDELFTYDDTRSGIPGVFDGLDRNEVNPPLYYLVAWAVQHLGDSPAWLRVPSLVLGAGTVPLVYLLGRRIAGSGAGLVAAALVALSPFAIFYSTEARAYASLAFLSALSALLLLKALERSSPRWWIAYGACVCAALYTHYTSVFPIGAEAAWAVFVKREHVRTVLITLAAAGVAYLPWVPSLIGQRENPLKVAVIGGGEDLSLRALADAFGRQLPGHPFVGLDTVPGTSALVVIAAIALAALVLALLHLRREAAGAERDPKALVLVAMLALAAPLGIAAYAIVGSNLLLARNLISCMPFLAVCLGALVAAIRPRTLAAASAAVLLAALAVGTGRALDADRQRPDYKGLAAYIDRAASPGDAVVNASFGGDPGLSLSIYFERPQRLFRANVDDGPAWVAAAGGKSAFRVQPLIGPFRGVQRFSGPNARYVLREQRSFPGVIGLTVGRYSGQVDARLEDGGRAIALSTGDRIRVTPGVFQGYVDSFEDDGSHLEIGGWAVADGDRAADWIAAFRGGRLVAATAPTFNRPDVPVVRSGTLVFNSFVAKGESGTGAGPVRVFAVTGDRATELPRT